MMDMDGGKPVSTPRAQQGMKQNDRIAATGKPDAQRLWSRRSRREKHGELRGQITGRLVP